VACSSAFEIVEGNAQSPNSLIWQPDDSSGTPTGVGISPLYKLLAFIESSIDNPIL
jgi:hypothetical protein